MRYTYAWGYKSHQQAERAVVDMMSEGTISAAERPQIERYEPEHGKRRYKITLLR